MPKFPKNKGYKSPIKHHGMSVDSKKVKAGHYHDPKKGIVVVKKSTPKIKTPTEYAPFKMKHAKGNPMKANFPTAFKGHMHTSKLADGRAGSAAFQMHDGKKFEDAGFMDTHFPSGKARTPAKQLDDKEKGKKIVRRMKQIEAKLAKNGNLS